MTKAEIIKWLEKERLENSRTKQRVLRNADNRYLLGRSEGEYFVCDIVLDMLENMER